MKSLIWTLAIVLTGAVLAGLARNDPGFAILGYGNWTVEMSLALFIAITLLAGTAIYYLVRLLVNIRRTPGRISAWSKQSGAKRAAKQLSKGLNSQAKGDWKKAERRLTAHANSSKNPGLHYLAAARVAQSQGNPHRRDHYLQQALKADTDEIAVMVTRAELQMNEGQMELALASLLELRRRAPKNGHVLRLLASVYRREQDWQSLSLLLPDLKARKVMADAIFSDLEKRTFRKLLENQNMADNIAALQQSWNRVPRHLKQQADLLKPYCNGLIRHELYDEAERLLKDSIQQQWNEELVRLYGFCPASNAKKQLDTAERWLLSHENNAMLLLTLGHLSMRVQLWGKARAYLESSLAADALPQTCYSLAKLLEAMGEQAEAAALYQQGLQANFADQADVPVPEQISRSQTG